MSLKGYSGGIYKAPFRAEIQGLCGEWMKLNFFSKTRKPALGAGVGGRRFSNGGRRKAAQLKATVLSPNG